MRRLSKSATPVFVAALGAALMFLTGMPQAGAGTITVTTNISGGALAFCSAPANTSFSGVQLDGMAVTSNGSTALDVCDASGLDAGWSIDGTSVPFYGSGYDAALAALDPLGWWKLADAAGATSASDSSGNGLTAAVSGAVTFGSPGPLPAIPGDTAASFSGATGSISLVAPSALQLSHSFSVSACFETASSAIQTIAQLGAAPWWSLQLVGGHIQLSDGHGDALSTNLAYDNGAYHCVTAEMANPAGLADAAIYVDGAPVATTQTGSWAPAGGSSPTFYIGTNGAGSTMTGRLAEVAVFGSALSASDVARLYTSGFSSLPTTATSIQSAPTVTCASSSSCTPASNSIAYPVTLPAGVVPPTPIKLFDAAPNTGFGAQAVTIPWSLAVPGTASSGSYAALLTLTLTSGP
jgi:hypothetical protein